MGTLFISIILLMRVVQVYFSKKTSTLFPTSFTGRMKYIAISNGISSLPALVLFVISMVGGGTADLQTVLIGLLSGVALACASLCGQLALQSGTVVMNIVFSTAGLIVPCIAGVFFFNEPMSVLQWCAIAVFIVASLLLASSSKQSNSKFSYKTVLLCIGSFLFNGATMLCQKWLTFTNPNANISLFSFATFAIPAIVATLIFSLGQMKGTKETLNNKIYLPILLLAVALFIINQLATAATNYVSSAVLFALINGGHTIIATIISAIFFKEKITVKSLCGLILGIGSLLIIKI